MGFDNGVGLISVVPSKYSSWLLDVMNSTLIMIVYAILYSVHAFELHSFAAILNLWAFYTSYSTIFFIKCDMIYVVLSVARLAECCASARRLETENQSLIGQMADSRRLIEDLHAKMVPLSGEAKNAQKWRVDNDEILRK